MPSSVVEHGAPISNNTEGDLADPAASENKQEGWNPPTRGLNRNHSGKEAQEGKLIKTRNKHHNHSEGWDLNLLFRSGHFMSV